MKCPQCSSGQEADSTFCDQCGEPLKATGVSESSPVETTLKAEEILTQKPVFYVLANGPWTRIFATQDFGEMAFVRSLLEDHGIPTIEPDQFAERFSFWTSSFFRTFSLAVPPNTADRARHLLKRHVALTSLRPEDPGKRIVAYGLLVLMSVAALFPLLLAALSGFFRIISR